MRLHYLPLERLDERYTEQMFKWCMAAFVERGHAVTAYFGESLSDTTNPDEFFSYESRAHYCLTQTARVMAVLDAGEIRSGDVIFVADLWHLGLEAIRYAAQMRDVDVKIYALHMAGPFDKTDLTAQLMPWGGMQEAAWMEAVDGVFVGSEYHLEIIRRGLAGIGAKVTTDFYVTGMVWDADDALNDATEPPPDLGPGRYVMWPHRLSPEKNFESFLLLARKLAPDFPDVGWFVTGGRDTEIKLPPPVEYVYANKGQYYALLADSDAVISTAYHENFGYVIHEATAFGAPVLCPSRANYTEMILSRDNLYDSEEELERKLRAMLNEKSAIVGPAKLKESVGIHGMINVMEGIPC